jgi:hypothetical protein
METRQSLELEIRIVLPWIGWEISRPLTWQ